MKGIAMARAPQDDQTRTESLTERPEPASTPPPAAGTVGAIGTSVKEGVVQSLRGVDEVEAEAFNVVRDTVSNAIRTTGVVANDVITVTRDVARGAIQATEETGNQLLGATRNVAKEFVRDVTDVGTDVGTLASSAAEGVVNTAARLGGGAVSAVRDLGVAAATGVKDIAVAILPRRTEQVASTSGEPAQTRPTRSDTGPRGSAARSE
jgi:hypothetical protein